MRFATYYFVQPPPGHSHRDIIHRELTQIE